MKIVCISDTHNFKIKIPKCDLVLHAGDMTKQGSEEEYKEFLEWYSEVPATHKVVIPGNHDFFCQRKETQSIEMAAQLGVTMLNCSSVDIGGFKIYGYPWQPRFYDWAFNANSDELKRMAAKIPECDILISHGPPKGILDKVKYAEVGQDPHVGDIHLLNRILEIKPRLVVTGHIHEASGTLSKDGIQFINASTCNLQYKPVNKPFQITLKKEVK